MVRRDVRGVSALFTYKMNIFKGKIFNCRSDVLLQSSMSRCRSRRRSWRRAILLLSSAVVVVVAVDLDRRPWRGEDSSDFGATGTWNSTSVRDQECFARSTQIHSHTYTHTQTTSIVCTISLWKLNVFNLQTSRTIPQTSSSVLYVKLQNHTRKTTSLANQSKHEI